MRGASAVQELLDKIPGTQLRVLVVWEPILWTDLKKPSGSILARLSDLGVVQFWDRNHVVAEALRAGLPQEGTSGIDSDRLSDEILWDDVAVYPPGPRWTDQPPQPNYFGGPVYDVIPNVTEALDRLTTRGSL